MKHFALFFKYYTCRLSKKNPKGISHIYIYIYICFCLSLVLIYLIYTHNWRTRQLGQAKGAISRRGRIPGHAGAGVALVTCGFWQFRAWG